jgi:hypothetical protein
MHLILQYRYPYNGEFCTYCRDQDRHQFNNFTAKSQPFEDSDPEARERFLTLDNKICRVREVPVPVHIFLFDVSNFC